LEIKRHQAGRGFLNFKTGALNHSATLPTFENAWLFGAKRRPNQDFRTALLPNVFALVYCCPQRAVNRCRSLALHIRHQV
jgi:hypothetical protein